MKEILCNSAYFGVTVSLIGYGAGIMLKKKFKYAFLNPLNHFCDRRGDVVRGGL